MQRFWRLYVQQKISIEISEIPNGVVQLNRPDLSPRVFGYCTRKQDAEEQYRGQQLSSNGKGHFGQSA